MKRSGFTLVELLVVIGIITLLAGILVVAIGRAGVIAKEQATAATIRKISNQVQERLEAFDRLRNQAQFTSVAMSRANSAGFTNATDNQKKIIGFKMLMREYFPQSLDEIRIFNTKDYAIITSPPFNASAATQNDPGRHTESSEALYFFLTRGSVLGIPTVDPAEYKSNEVADTDGDGLLEFVDAWGKPLRFYRWPTRLFRSRGPMSPIDRPPAVPKPAWLPLVNGVPSAPPAGARDPLAKDQDDPKALLTNVAGFSESTFHTPQTYHVFLIVSSGPDGLKKGNPNDAFGLYPPTDQFDPTTQFGYLAQPTGDFDALTDNITNRNR
jgi:prepilin-type N-terminal cleavage/methylation domain-containing protein